MDKSNWIETKKECEVNEEGNLIVKKVTLELQKKKFLGLERKDFIDTILKFIGLISIAVPVLLFYFQQSVERKKQKALLQTDLYTNTTTQLHKILNKDLTRKEFDSAKDKILFEYYPKMTLLSNDSIVELLDKINYNISHYSGVLNFASRFDSIYNDNFSSIIVELVSARLWEPLYISIDSSKLEDLRQRAFQLSQDLIDYKNEWVSKYIDFSSPPRGKSKSDGYFNKISNAMKDLDSIQYSNFIDMIFLNGNIQSYKKNIKNYNKSEINKELTDKIESIIANNTNYWEALNKLMFLRKEYHKYIEHLVQKLDIQFIQSNRFLNKD